MTREDLLNMAAEEGFAAFAVVDTNEIPFDHSFRPYCEENLCGKYGANYSCPPDCGSCQEMEDRVKAGNTALVLQTIWEISDYSDAPAIKHAKSFHNNASLSLADKLQKAGVPGFVVGASGCALCETCAITEGAPCRFPDRMYSCMSAYCIFVKQLCDRCGLDYDCGPGLLGFFGMYVCDL